jgi:malate dehydrogenase
MQAKNLKISFIGAGGVSVNTAFAAGLSGICREIVLIDIYKGMALGKAMDLEQGFSLAGLDIKCKGTTNYEHIDGSDVIVITAGDSQRPLRRQGVSVTDRESLVSKNRMIIESVSNQIRRVFPAKKKQPLIITLTNPLDPILAHFIKTGGYDKRLTIGSGNLLDGARFKYYFGREFGVKSSDIKPVVIGQHGREMVYALSQSKVGKKPLLQYVKERGGTEKQLEKICAQATNGANEIINLIEKGGTWYGPAVSILDLINAYANDTREVVSVSTWLNGQYGVKGFCLGVPVRLGRKGVEEIIELKLTPAEQEAFARAADFVKTMI